MPLDAVDAAVDSYFPIELRKSCGKRNANLVATQQVATQIFKASLAIEQSSNCAPDNQSLVGPIKTTNSTSTEVSLLFARRRCVALSLMRSARRDPIPLYSLRRDLNGMKEISSRYYVHVVKR